MAFSINRLFSTLAAGTACSIGFLGMQSLASAATLSPSSYEATIDVGETITINKTLTLDETPLNKVDVFFMADNTGSMGSVIRGVQSSATSLLNSLAADFSDIAFGVGRYLGDPSEPSETRWSAYQLIQPITTSQDDTQSAINTWFARGGGDWPEANLFALHQGATSGGSTNSGVSTNQETGWRPGAAKIMIWFGDAPSHTRTVGLPETIAALTDNDITVAALNTRGAGRGIDTYGQASTIVNATNGILTNYVNSGGVVDAIKDALGDLTSTIDLEFDTIGDTSGLDISFACTDSLGCTDVEGGEIRTFDLIITGLTEGLYDFDAIVVGVDGAVEDDLITVRAEKVPEPSSVFSLLAFGAFGAGSSLLKRKRQQKDIRNS